jgi:hypothetical protein
LEQAADASTVKKELAEVYYAQVESKKQAEGSITPQEIHNITLYKGGASLVFYRTAFSPAATPGETRLLYDFGGAMQLANDIFDAFKDREAGIRTLLTTATDIRQLRTEFDMLLDKGIHELIGAMRDKKAGEEFLCIVSLGIFSRCYVCLDHLNKAQKIAGDRFRVQEYTRKQLICDMDILPNMLRSAVYHVKIMEKLSTAINNGGNYSQK